MYQMKYKYLRNAYPISNVLTDTEGGDGQQHRSSVHIKLEHQGNLRMVQHGLRTIQTSHTSISRDGFRPPLSPYM